MSRSWLACSCPTSEETRLATLGLALVGFGFSAYLTYRELFSIHAICEWCVSSAVIMTLLLLGATVRYLRGADPEQSTAPPPGRPQQERQLATS